MLSLSKLKSFVGVAKAHGMRPAADELRRTPSTISMAVKELEEEIGAPLFESDRKAELSAVGKHQRFGPNLSNAATAVRSIRTI
jgi:DNA-binding transcriptional LysR family regulator